MKRETEEIVHKGLDLFPLKSYPNIIQANALQIDWKNFAPDVDYIISNPPFVGRRYRSVEQQSEVARFFKYKDIDYVACWYHLAAKIMKGTKIKSAFVSTNSITQGEQVAPLWKKLFDEYDMQIIFGRRTFKWDSESFHKAAIHCVVVGMCDKNLSVDKKIFEGEEIFPAQNINPYLVDAPTIFIESRASHYQSFVPKIFMGSTMVDDGNYNFTADELKNFLKLEPSAQKWIRPLIGSDEFINGKKRFCLYLENASPEELRKMKLVYKRIQAVKDFRLASKRAATRKGADIPTVFLEIRQPTTDYVLIPKVSSERRRYIPIGFMDAQTVALNTVLIIPDATTYHFGILTSSIHMAWMRAVAGRLEMRYQYSATVVYNNFAWCEPTYEQKNLIETTAQNILDVRKNYPHSTLADLYDELTMPADLRLAHKKNDRAVATAYGFENFLDDESKIVAELMKLYERFTNQPLPPQ